MASDIFNYIKGIHQQPKQQPVPVKTPEQDTVNIIQTWKKSKDPKQTALIVQYLKPTIEAALKSYTPGQQGSYRVKATTYALDSLRSFDPTKKVSPKTYVMTNLQRLNRIRRDRDNMIHIPQNQVYASSLISRTASQFAQDTGRQPTDQQLADKLHISVAKLNKLRDNSSTISSSMGLNQQGMDVHGKSDVTDDDYYKYVYNSVSPTDQKIMQWTSGYGKQAISNNQIAKRLNMSPGAVSQRKAKIQQMLGDVRGLV